MISYNIYHEDWTVNKLLTTCIQVEKRLREEKIESMNFASPQISKKACQEKGVLEGKKVLTMVLGEIINEVVKYFFHTKEGHLKKNCMKYKKWL